MGEYADMMLDGTLCACCGDFIGEDAGYPIYCSEACEPDGYAEAMGRPTPASEAIADAFETGRTPDWFAIARAITGSHARDLGFPITERTDHDQA